MVGFAALTATLRIPGAGNACARRSACGIGVQRHQAVVVVVAQAADQGGHAAQGGLRTGAAGFAQGDEPGRDFDQQDVRHRCAGRRRRLGLGHDGTPFRPTPGGHIQKRVSAFAACVGRAQARRQDQDRPDGATAQSTEYTPAFTHLWKDEYGQSAARKACPCFTGL